MAVFKKRAPLGVKAVWKLRISVAVDEVLEDSMFLIFVEGTKASVDWLPHVAAATRSKRTTER
jgi:hypothetical protein